MQNKINSRLWCYVKKVHCEHVCVYDVVDLLLHDILQTQHHAQLALHLLPVGSTFCQVAHGLQGQGQLLSIHH